MGYSDETGEPLIPYSDYSLAANIHPLTLEDAILPFITDDVRSFPRPCTFQKSEPLDEYPFELPAELMELQGLTVKKTSTIYPLIAKSPFLSDIRKIVITKLYGKNGIFQDVVGELWIGRRWIDGNLHSRLSEYAI